MMEAVNNVAAMAAKTVWGDVNTAKEPISGAKGDVSKGEPYDAGNLEPTRQEQVEQSLEGRHFENTSAPAEENMSFQQHNAVRSDDIPAKIEPPITESATPEVPNKSNKINETLEGYNSRPAEEFNSRPTENAPLPPTMGSMPNKSPAMEPFGSKLPPDENEDDPSSRGTGQEYIRSTGLAADGGDFDATKPGAGREADRLMEEKGLHHDEDGEHGGQDKPGLGHRIKAKLHMH